MNAFLRQSRAIYLMSLRAFIPFVLYTMLDLFYFSRKTSNCPIFTLRWCSFNSYRRQAKGKNGAIMFLVDYKYNSLVWSACALLDVDFDWIRCSVFSIIRMWNTLAHRPKNVLIKCRKFLGWEIWTLSKGMCQLLDCYPVFCVHYIYICVGESTLRAEKGQSFALVVLKVLEHWEKTYCLQIRWNVGHNTRIVASIRIAEVIWGIQSHLVVINMYDVHRMDNSFVDHTQTELCMVRLTKYIFIVHKKIDNRRPTLIPGITKWKKKIRDALAHVFNMKLMYVK